MEIDLGGIGKEYAVDRALTLAKQHTEVAVLVNLGGDLRVSGPRRGSPWQVAIATSGDTYRRIIQSGMRYSHVLDPQSGWPVIDAPRTVTVHANTCSEAGRLLAKLALLRGADAEAFLKAEQVRAWCIR